LGGKTARGNYRAAPGEVAVQRTHRDGSQGIGRSEGYYVMNSLDRSDNAHPAGGRKVRRDGDYNGNRDENEAIADEQAGGGSASPGEQPADPPTCRRNSAGIGSAAAALRPQGPAGSVDGEKQQEPTAGDNGHHIPRQHSKRRTKSQKPQQRAQHNGVSSLPPRDLPPSARIRVAFKVIAMLLSPLLRWIKKQVKR